VVLRTLALASGDSYPRWFLFCFSVSSKGFKEEALSVATDPEHQFELAVQLGKLKTAYDITTLQPSEVREIFVNIHLYIYI